MARGKKWTKEEDAYLEEAWGTKSVAAIAKHLDRSINAINVRKTRNGLGRFLENGDYITYSQLLQAVFGLDSAEGAYRISKRWVDFPMRKKKERQIELPCRISGRVLAVGGGV